MKQDLLTAVEKLYLSELTKLIYKANWQAEGNNHQARIESSASKMITLDFDDIANLIKKISSNDELSSRYPVISGIILKHREIDLDDLKNTAAIFNIGGKLYEENVKPRQQAHLLAAS